MLTVGFVFLVRELRLCTVPRDEETASLLGQKPHRPRFKRVNIQGIDSTQTMFSQGTYSTDRKFMKTEQQKFPGKGYSLK